MNASRLAQEPGRTTGRIGRATAPLCSALARQQQRLAAWLFRARTPEAGPVVLSHRRIFTLPTGAGMAFAAALVVMLLASINYLLSLGHGLTFLLAGIALVSLLHAYRNLLRLEIRFRGGPPVFAGAPATLELSFRGAGLSRPALRAKVGQQDWSTRFDIDAEQGGHVRLSFPTERRGWHRPGLTQIETRYPLGLVRAWTVLNPDAPVLVWPRPEPNPPPLPADGARTEGRSRPQPDGDDFAGLRAYRDGDAPGHIAWKAVARGGPLRTKTFASATGGTLVLDWQHLPAELDTEARLARLTAWWLEAYRLGQPVALNLPGVQLAAGQDAAHHQLGLRHLALHGLDD